MDVGKREIWKQRWSQRQRNINVVIYFSKKTVVGNSDSMSSFCMKVTAWYPEVRWLQQEAQHEYGYISQSHAVLWVCTCSRILRASGQYKGWNSPCNLKQHQRTRYEQVRCHWKWPHTAQPPANYTAYQKSVGSSLNSRVGASLIRKKPTCFGVRMSCLRMRGVVFPNRPSISSWVQPTGWRAPLTFLIPISMTNQFSDLKKW